MLEVSEYVDLLKDHASRVDFKCTQKHLIEISRLLKDLYLKKETTLAILRNVILSKGTSYQTKSLARRLGLLLEPKGSWYTSYSVQLSEEETEGMAAILKDPPPASNGLKQAMEEFYGNEEEKRSLGYILPGESITTKGKQLREKRHYLVIKAPNYEAPFKIKEFLTKEAAIEYKRKYVHDTTLYHEAIYLSSFSFEALIDSFSAYTPAKYTKLELLEEQKTINEQVKGEVKSLHEALKEGKFRDTLPGYHVALIKKGKLGEISKIQEELDELKDAETQGVKIMAGVELSDLLGAIEAYAVEKHGLSLEDLIQMNEVTKRAFKSGARK